MRRFITEKLIKWKESNSRKPLILRGACQVGKTYILKDFGENYYENVAYFNFDYDDGLSDLFLNIQILMKQIKYHLYGMVFLLN